MTRTGGGGTAPGPRNPEDIADRRAGQPRPWALAGLLALAAALRLAGIGDASLWYDEVVSYRVAAAPTPAAALRLLRETDATAAPLHPLLLRGWFRAFGTSEAAGRAFSALCGVATVGVIFALGRRLGGERAGWWAGGLAALSPPLVYYARELRMYALLTLLTSLAWWVVASGSRGSRWRAIAYVALLVAIGYTHPLGGLMIGTLAIAAGLDARRAGPRSLAGWFAVHSSAALLLIPAVRLYTDHAPTYDEPAGRSLRLLLGFPIGFTGGNFAVLAGCLAVIGFGLWARPQDRHAATLLLLWLLTPVLVLYAASWLGRPLFGPARYTLFVAPAYLLLLGRGLARPPGCVAAGVAAVLLAFAAPALRTTVYADGLKADWRAASALIRAVEGSEAPIELAIAVVDPRYVGELEVARHYLGDRAHVRVAEAPWPDARGWLAAGLRDGVPAARLPLDVAVPTPVIEVHRVPGLLLMHTTPSAP